MVDPITQMAIMSGWMRKQREKQAPRPGPTMDAWRARIPQDIDGVWPDEKLGQQVADAVNFVKEFTPLGDVEAAGRVYQDVRKGKPTWGTALDAVSVVPIIGSIGDASRAARIASDVAKPLAGTLSPRFAAMAAQRAAVEAEREALRKAAQEAAEARGIKLFGEAKPAAPAAPSPKPPKRVRFKDVPEQEWQQFDNTAGPDDYVYHVTHSKAAPSIKRDGLQPSAGGSLFKHGGYGEYSKGKAFVTDRDGVSFWADRVGQQLEHQFDNPPRLKVLRLPKAEAKGLEIDELGTKDAGAKAFFSRGQLGLLMAALGLGSAAKLMPREERRGIQPL